MECRKRLSKKILMHANRCLLWRCVCEAVRELDMFVIEAKHKQQQAMKSRCSWTFTAAAPSGPASLGTASGAPTLNH